MTTLTHRTPISTLSFYKIKKIIKLGTEFCVLNLGKSKNKQYPTVRLSGRTDIPFMGEYDAWDHDVWVYYKHCKNVEQLVKTLIHEWVHSTQRIKTDYKRLHKKHGYHNNPLEIEAYAAEKIWFSKSFKYIKQSW